MLSAQQLTELRNYFAIKTDLGRATKGANLEDVEHHLDELKIMAMHTTSGRLVRACNETIGRLSPPPTAAFA